MLRPCRYTALLLASAGGHLDTMKLLVSKGADVNKCDRVSLQRGASRPCAMLHTWGGIDLFKFWIQDVFCAQNLEHRDAGMQNTSQITIVSAILKNLNRAMLYFVIY